MTSELKYRWVFALGLLHGAVCLAATNAPTNSARRVAEAGATKEQLESGTHAAPASRGFRVRLAGGGIAGEFAVTTNETSCGRLSWDGVPDKTGAMSGGQYEITVQMADNAIVLKERTRAADKGIGSDITARTIIPTSKVPWTGRLSQATVTVFRVERKLTADTEGR